MVSHASAGINTLHINMIQFILLTRGFRPKVSVRDAWWTRPTLFDMTLISQPVFLVIPFWKVLTNSLTRARSIHQNQNRTVKKRIGLFYLFNICQILTSVYTLNKLPVNILVHSLCNHSMLFHSNQKFDVNFPWLVSAKACPPLYSHFYYFGLRKCK